MVLHRSICHLDSPEIAQSGRQDAALWAPDVIAARTCGRDVDGHISGIAPTATYVRKHGGSVSKPLRFSAQGRPSSLQCETAGIEQCSTTKLSGSSAPQT
jgi:hypothetical protein